MSKRIPALLAALSLCSAMNAAADDTRTTKLDVSEQPLSTSLRQVAEEFDLTIAFYSESTEGLQAPQLEGTYSPSTAFDTLLADTNLEYTYISDTSVAVRPKGVTSEDSQTPGKFLPASSPTLMAQNETTQAPRIAQTDEDREAEKELDVIVVTGTQIRGIANETIPVVSVDRREIELSGAQSLADIARLIPQNFGGQISPLNVGGSSNPFAVPDNTGSSASAFDLRGLGSDATLTLLNGRRLPPSSDGGFVDISRLPVGIIQRVDVLLDGAAAAYGSDAVAGVINIVTARDFEGLELSANAGSVTEGSKFDHGATAVAGTRWNAGGVWASVGFRDSEPLSGASRSFTSFDNPDAQLMGGNESISAFVSFDQQLTPATSVTVDAIYNESTSRTRIAPEISNFDADADRSDFTVYSALHFDIGQTWSSSVSVDYAESDTAVTALRPDGSFWFNFRETENKLTTFEANVSGVLMPTRAGDVTAAFGVQHRRDEYTPLPAGFAVEADRETSAVYAEAMIPLFGGERVLPLVKKLYLNLSARYEEFTDIGDTTNPRLGLYWQATDGLAFRGSASTSFRAPTLFNKTILRSIAVVPRFDPNLDPADQDPRLPAGHSYVASVRGGNPDLTEQTSDNWSVGFTYSPPRTQALNVEINYFDIDFTDRVANVPFNALEFPEYASLIVRDPSVQFLQAQFDEIIELQGPNAIFNFLPFDAVTGQQLPIDLDDVQVWVFGGMTNIGRVQVRGFDGLFEYGWPVGGGELNAQAKISYLNDMDFQATPTVEPTQQVNRIYRPVGLSGRASLYWTTGGLTAAAFINYTDDYIDNISSATPTKVPSWTTLDASVAYSFSERFQSDFNLTAMLSVQNLFDRDPPFINSSDGFGYDTTNATPLGRYVSLRLVSRW